MVESGRVLLRRLLVSGYEDLKRRLTRRFGSADMATEVLHETWLRLDHATEIGTVQRPKSYLYRMALNVAIGRRRADTSWFGKAELEVLLRSGDDQLDPEHIVSMRSEIAALEHVLGELPYRDIAKRMGISLRSVEREMSRAFEHCGKHFEKMREGRRVGASRNVLQVDPMRDSADSHDEE
jgi:RNA polymerase sigma-70 factor (ECF subfamily)